MRPDCKHALFVLLSRNTLSTLARSYLPEEKEYKDAFMFQGRAVECYNFAAKIKFQLTGGRVALCLYVCSHFLKPTIMTIGKMQT